MPSTLRLVEVLERPSHACHLGLVTSSQALAYLTGLSCI